ncbi:hypothetical protein ACQP1G_17025 [Nocardia sp. CA-107356]|uniref:nSTAND1 domain-containing NTPase n=1 Tax=Nocardia sp. CA-107356 TaxID=3239972 RepID=UPI003D8F34AE
MELMNTDMSKGLGSPRRQHRSPRREFALRFDALYVAGGSPSLRLLASAARKRVGVVKDSGRPVAVTAQRISDWKTGRNVPSRFEALLPVLLVLIDATRRRGQIARVELVSLRMWKGLWAAAQATRTAHVSAAATCPFPGAAPYSTQEAAAFASRDTAVHRLIQLVLDAETSSRSKRVVALMGASGVGKTSLLQAGLAPELESRERVVHSMVLGANPLASVEDVLNHLEFVCDALCKTADIENAGSPRPHLVIIDQFERIFSTDVWLTAGDSFMTMIERLAEYAVVLISLRAGDSAACADHPILVDVIEHRMYLLEPMNHHELRAVTISANRDGIQVEAGLEEVLLTAISGVREDGGRRGHEPAALSILSRTLKAMYPKRMTSRLTVAGYKRIGGIVGIIHDMADELWAQLDLDERATAKRILLNLVSVHTCVDDTRRRVPGEYLRRVAGSGSLGRVVLDKLIDARIVTVDVNDAYLGHDLLLGWKPLADWLEGERSALLVRGRTAADSSEWIAADRHPSLLYRGLRLATAMNFLDDADEVVVEFLRESSMAEQSERLTAR